MLSKILSLKEYLYKSKILNFAFFNLLSPAAGCERLLSDEEAISFLFSSKIFQVDKILTEKGF